jgi:hypothetical protein
MLRYSVLYSLPISFISAFSLCFAFGECLYASILSALLFADIVYFCVFSVFRFWRSACMLRYLMRYAVPMRHTAISRSESQVRGGRLLVVTLAEPP